MTKAPSFTEPKSKSIIVMFAQANIYYQYLYIDSRLGSTSLASTMHFDRLSVPLSTGITGREDDEEKGATRRGFCVLPSVQPLNTAVPEGTASNNIAFPSKNRPV